MTLAIIAAGGKGTRMKSKVPKPLTLLPNGDTFLFSMVKKLEPLVEQVVVVTNPQVMSDPRHQIDKKSIYRIQVEATGMGDAVFCASDLIKNHEEVLILWCDQIGITAETITKTIEMHRNMKSDSCMTIPVLTKETQYIHIDYSEMCINEIYQSKEGDSVPLPSKSDIGLFMFSSGANLVSAWEEGGREYSRGRLTQEYNFLPLLKYLSLNDWSFQEVEASLRDGIGINTQEELISAVREKVI
jgi:bifunctional N-acetylglucosamine-1-phosphate-uridyltransferase/glucosamine-1-phosphate-acetyltransferase GlmU-like protein